MAISLGWTQLLSSMLCFPLAAWVAPACLCDLGESQWNPGGDSAGTSDTPIPEGKTLSGHHRCQSLQKHPGVCRRRLQGLLQVSVSGCFFLFCRTTNNLAKFVSPWAGHPQPQGNSCPWICSFMSGAHFLNTWRKAHCVRGTDTICTKTGSCTTDSHAAFLLLTSFIIFWFTVTCVLFHNIPDHAAIPEHFRCLSEAQLPVFICRQRIVELLQMCA